MSEIKINEIKNDFSNIEIVTYLPYVVKNTILNKIIDSVIIDTEQGLKKVNYSLLTLSKEIILVSNYTNIEISQEDVIESYDILKKSGVIEYVLKKMDKEEFLFYEKTIKQELRQIKEIDNSISGVLSNLLGKFIEKIPDSERINDMLPKLSEELGKISPETIDFLKSVNNK